MKRWRPLILVAILLLAGAVVNVGVAWGIVLRMGLPSTEQGAGSPPAFHLAPVRLSDEYQFHSSYWVAARWRPLKAASGGWWVVKETHSYAVQTISLGDGSSMRVDPQVSRSTIAAGWPLLALRVSYDIGAFRQRTAVSGLAGGIAAPHGLVNNKMKRTAERRLPIDPLTSGFLLNTVFYAVLVGAILALPLRASPIRRRLRAPREMCEVRV